MLSGNATPQEFVDYWSKAEANERANAQMFLAGLAALLGVPAPSHSHASGYSFEYPVKIPTGPGAHTDGFLDLYRRGCFVLEAKQFVAPKPEQTDLELVAAAAGAEAAGKRKSGPLRGSDAWDDAMWRAKGQAERYARHLPAEEPPAPFLLVVDVGHTIEIYADFTQAGRAYQPYPDPRSFRLRLADLLEEKVRERLRAIWLDPLSLDPARISADVTRTIAGYLAELAKSLEDSGHPPRLVAEFLTRCLFCMFAEDVGLLPKEGFRGLLERLRQSPEGFVPMLRQLFAEMQTGTDFSVVLNKKLLRFNGGLFHDASVLPLNGTQLGILILASKQQWKDVEPAIFGTLLERALDPEERHQLGAHYTPRAYVERLVLPTVIEPLRAEWETVRAAALVHAQRGDLQEARDEVNAFHDRLCKVTVLDPACGSGNFLYVALQHLKLLEGEVLDAGAQFGETFRLELETHTVDPHQFLGIELNPRAASIAELVLWIGYLQWHHKLHGERVPNEPILRAFHNIENRDAVLAWDGEPQPARDEKGEVITVWDRRSMKTDLLTGRDVPDESKRVPLMTYPNARPAEWPAADYIVGNPPFLGNKRMRDALGSGYTEALRAAYPSVPETADLVMYWWEKAATLLLRGTARRFGLITTNSLRMIFNRGLVQRHLKDLSLVFAIPDHPWVDAVDGAAVRISMTIATAGHVAGELQTVVAEDFSDDDSSHVTLKAESGRIAADLTVGADVAAAVALKANESVCFQGMNLVGEGFRVSPEQARSLGHEFEAPLSVIRRYQKGRELVQGGTSGLIIDAWGFSADELRTSHPAVYQHLLTHVKPNRDQNNRAAYRERWWLFGEPRRAFRASVAGLSRFIATVETSKFKPFVFIEADVVPDHKLYAITLDDAFFLGVLSSRIHQTWALAAGGTLEDRPTWTNTTCFLPFPFPPCDETTKARIRALAEQLDAHRKRVQAQHPEITLTAMYNVLEALRAGRALTVKEQAIHAVGLVSILRQLHDDLDWAVARAYGWPVDLSDAEILERLVELNAERAREEANGLVRYLRPEYQNPAGRTAQPGLYLPAQKEKSAKAKAPARKEPWPKPLAERVAAVERVLKETAAPATAAHLAKRFLRAKAEDLTEILETLATLGRANRDGDRFTI